MSLNDVFRKSSRISFRLPNGEAIVESFDSDRPFDDARRFIMGAMDIRGSFSLIKMYPRQEFVGDDFSKSFRELDLAPSAVVVVSLVRSQCAKYICVGSPITSFDVSISAILDVFRVKFDKVT